MKLARPEAMVLGLLFAATPSAWATWSVVATDTVTGEVGVASATCVAGLDLAALSPVVVVGEGAAAAQSVGDTSAENRRVIRDGLVAGDDLDTILDRLESGDPLHQSRQYGLADTVGDALAFTGANAGPFAGDGIGELGTLRYAIQGNLLTGAPVLDRAEQAFRSVDGDLPTRLMASLIAAYRMGGDGRCSCSLFNPTGCGSPPESFDKSADVGFLIVARPGDVDGGCDAIDGCASGSYYLRLNVAFQLPSDPDPVLQLRGQFVAARRAQIGRPDHFLSTAVADPPTLPADGVGTSTVTIELRDWRDVAVGDGGAEVTMTLAPDTTATPAIGPVVDLGDGRYAVTVTAPDTPGTARLRIEVDDGGALVRLSPSLAIEVGP